MEKADTDDWWPRWVWVGECFFWYRLTRVVPDKIHRAVKRLCVWVYSIFSTSHQIVAVKTVSKMICFVSVSGTTLDLTINWWLHWMCRKRLPLLWSRRLGLHSSTRTICQRKRCSVFMTRSRRTNCVTSTSVCRPPACSLPQRSHMHARMHACTHVNMLVALIESMSVSCSNMSFDSYKAGSCHIWWL